MRTDEDRSAAVFRPSTNLVDRGLQKLIAEIDIMPSPPAAVLKMNEVLSRQDAQIEDLVVIIEADPAMTAKLLAITNSAFLGLPRRITSVRQSAAYLGIENIRNLLTAVELMRAFTSPDDTRIERLNQIQQHSLTVADTARQLMTGTPAMHDAYAAGMLHDAGMLALLSAAPHLFDAVHNRGADVAEVEVLGTTHALVGAYILDLWGLPWSIVEAVLHSHDASTALEPPLTTAHAVFVAEQLSNIVDNQASPWDRVVMPTPEYLESVGLETAVTNLVGNIHQISDI